MVWQVLTSLKTRLARLVDTLGASEGAVLQRCGGALFREDGDERKFLGSCCAYRRSNLFLTAAHCIPDCPPAKLRIATGSHSEGDEEARVLHVETHLSADLAALITAPHSLGLNHLPEVSTIIGPGLEVDAFGFPLESDADSQAPTAKYYRGVIQRLFEYRQGKYSYDALELGIPAPAGLSGGAVALPIDHDGLIEHSLIGIVTTDREASRSLRTTIDVTEGESHYVERVEGVMLHAIAVDLTEMSDWLTEQYNRAAVV
jgi:hypothetical protein